MFTTIILIISKKYIDIFAGTFGFWLLGYAISGNTDALVLGEDQDYIFWFFRVSDNENNQHYYLWLVWQVTFLLL